MTLKSFLSDRSETPRTIVGASAEDVAFVEWAQRAASAAGVTGLNPNPGLTTLGTPVTSVATATTAAIDVTIRKGTFVGRRLIIPAENAASWRITDVKVGSTSIFPSNDPIPGEAFSSLNQRGGELPFIPAPVSQIITIYAYNETGGTVIANFAIEGALV